MGAVVLLFAVFLLDLCETKGSSTVTPVFVQTGKDLLLDVKEPVTLDDDSDFIWRHNGAINIVKVSGNNKPKTYKEGAESLGNYSLLLKNVQQKDSGMYNAVISAAKDRTVAEYKVTVQDPVSAVNLTVNCSSAPNITVTCSTVDSRISSTFRCDNKTCSRERSDATTDPSSIDVYLDEGFIICNHSNHVSWEHKKEIKSKVCEPPPVTSHVNWTATGIRLAVIGTVVVICSSLIIKYLLQKTRTWSSAVTPVFVKKGDDLLLNVTEDDVPEDFSIVAWKIRENILVTFFNQGKPKVSDAYTGRVEFLVKKFSVKLKNLQEADSGVYTARVTGQKEQTLVEYNVTVQAPVSPVGLTVDSVSNSSDSCNLTVTCSTQDSHISSTLRCDTQTCSQEGGERSEVTTSGASLHVYLETDSIICNHSNQVSWTKNMTDIQDFCPQHAGSQPSLYIYVFTFAVVVAGFVIFAGHRHLRQRRKNKRENTENTIYAVPETLQQGDHSPHEMGATARPADPTNDASGPSPVTEYSFVGLHSGSTETRGNTLPESLYAQIDRSVGRAAKRQENE
ncbi:uncharacterized protein LOC109140109 [Larimichthys crocea]|uniref:uncharacterized protein LOC109140109 n=1 Tax=Larimichthys crocea TaxID=215358 RepID=UPI000F5E5385|nr:uncharacterized protein LOC109140109 [Larimichthys crocea]